MSEEKALALTDNEMTKYLLEKGMEKIGPWTTTKELEVKEGIRGLDSSIVKLLGTVFADRLDHYYSKLEDMISSKPQLLKKVLQIAKDLVKDCPDHKIHEYEFSFGDNSGTLHYIVIAWQWAKDRQTLKHYMICGDARFTLVPSKTIITETRSH